MCLRKENYTLHCTYSTALLSKVESILQTLATFQKPQPTFQTWTMPLVKKSRYRFVSDDHEDINVVVSDTSSSRVSKSSSFFWLKNPECRAWMKSFRRRCDYHETSIRIPEYLIERMNSYGMGLETYAKYFEWCWEYFILNDF